MSLAKTFRTNSLLFLLFILSAVTLSQALAAEGRFLTLDDGTVQDQKTGLIWASRDNGSNITWSSAKKYCENYTKGGFRDWRMPTASELKSLYAKSPKVKGKDYSQLIDMVTTSIKISAPWVWTNRRRSGTKSSAFGFNYGVTRGMHRGTGSNRRALPVRTPTAKLTHTL